MTYVKHTLIGGTTTVMVTIPSKMHPFGNRPLTDTETAHSAQSLRPTFEGWGPRL